MASFVTPANGDDALAEHVAQLTEDFSGLRNIPIGLTGINDAAAYAQTIKNAGTGSKGLIIYAADGTTVLLQVDATGVSASRTGGAAERVLTTGESATITPAMLAATAWTAFTPSLDQGGAGLTVTVNYARYQARGKLAVLQAKLSITSVGSAGQVFLLNGIPAAVAPRANGTIDVAGTFIYHDNGTARYQGAVVALDADSFAFQCHNVDAFLGAGPSFTAASGDSLYLNCSYEIA